MGVVLMFAAGYVLGSRRSDESVDEVVHAVRAIRESDEFNGLVKAVRGHVAGSLRGLAGLLERASDESTGDGPPDLLDRVRLLTGGR